MLALWPKDAQNMNDTKEFIVNVMANTPSIIVITKELEKSVLKVCASLRPSSGSWLVPKF